MTLYGSVGVGGGGWRGGGGDQNEAIRLTKCEVLRFDLQHCSAVFVLCGGTMPQKQTAQKQVEEPCGGRVTLKQYSRSQLLCIILFNSARSLLKAP